MRRPHSHHYTRPSEEDSAEGHRQAAIRKALKKKAERRHHQPTCWIGGVLYFECTREPVPGIPRVGVAKNGKIGLEAAFAPRQPHSRVRRPLSMKMRFADNVYYADRQSEINAWSGYRIH